MAPSERFYRSLENLDENAKVSGRTVLVDSKEMFLELEEIFWSQLGDIARAEKLAVDGLIRRAIEAYPNEEPASAIRCYQVRYFRQKARH